MIPSKIKELEREIEEYENTHRVGKISKEYWKNIGRLDILKELSSEIEKVIDEWFDNLVPSITDDLINLDEKDVKELKQKLLGGEDDSY